MNLTIKKLDLLILKSFMGPFVVTFFIVLFAFTMQFYWLYMDELIGKGLGIGLTLQLMVYMSATLFPIALPLGILLASIMTFGNLGENFELVAIKSTGISLFRFMRPLVLFIAFISILAFLFNNYVIPVTNLKSYSLLYDMRNQKPTLNIREGIFNREIDNFAIRVGKKERDGQTIRDIIIYDHTERGGNNNIVLAKEGRMYPSGNNRYLVFELHDGWRYEEDNDQVNQAQTRMHFGKWYKVFDLSKFAFSRTKEELFKGNEEMMNVGQLSSQIDSLRLKRKQTLREMARNLNPYFTLMADKSVDSAWQRRVLQATDTARLAYANSFFEYMPDTARAKVSSRVESNLRNIQRLMKITLTDSGIQQEKTNTLKIEWHKKFTLSFACMLLFLIGAPLGAIIRKGGLGMPVLIAIAFFIIYFIISSTGEKLAQQGAVTPWYGMWMATAVLLPVAFIMMVQARNDAAVMRKELYTRLWERFKSLFTKSKS